MCRVLLTPFAWDVNVVLPAAETKRYLTLQGFLPLTFYLSCLVEAKEKLMVKLHTTKVVCKFPLT